MNHTEGKWEIMPYTRRDGDNIRWVKAVKDKRHISICQTFKPNAEANATELVRRWNAFEEGGSHKALVEACSTFVNEVFEGVEVLNILEATMGNKYSIWLQGVIQEAETALALNKEKEI